MRGAGLGELVEFDTPGVQHSGYGHVKGLQNSIMLSVLFSKTKNRILLVEIKSVQMFKLFFSGAKMATVGEKKPSNNEREIIPRRLNICILSPGLTLPES